jgi:predicted ATP-binding protein involved in virulence
MRNIVGTPVRGEDYFERPKLTKKIWQALNNGNNLLISSPRRVGKTSLLYNLCHRPTEGFVFIYINVESVHNAEEFVGRVFRSANQKVPHKDLSISALLKYSLFGDEIGAESVKPAKFDLKDRLLKLFQSFVQINPEQRLVIVLDELPQALSNITQTMGELAAVQILQILRELYQAPNFQRIQFIYSGALDYRVVFENQDIISLLNDLQPVEIRPFTHLEGVHFVQRLLKKVDFSMSEIQIEYMLDKVQWLMAYPIQLLFQAICNAVIDEDLTTVTSDVIELSVAETINNKLLFEAVFDEFDNADHDFIDQLFAYSVKEPDMHKDNIAKIAQQHGVSKGYAGVLRKLEFAGYIQFDSDKNVYQIQSGLMQAWVLKRYGSARATLPAIKFNHIKITALNIKNIKCFDNTELEFGASNNIELIIGPNARGKTTLLQLIALGLSGVKFMPFPYSWKQVVKVGNEKGEFSLAILSDGKPERLSFEVDDSDAIRCTEGAEVLKSIQQQFLLLAYGANRHIKLEDPRPYPALEGIATLFGENGYLKHIKVSENYNYVAANFPVIQQLINSVLEKADFQKKVQLGGYDAKSLYFETSEAKDLPIEALSEGFKSTFVWLFDMIVRIVEKGGDLTNAQSITGIVLLDEVDLHLHPSWQRTILPSLEAIFSNIQFIVTSHSPFVAQSINNDRLISLEWEDDRIGVVYKDAKVARSYDTTVSEVFGITTPFSHNMSQKIDCYRQMQLDIRKGNSVDDDEFKALVESIASSGEELNEVMRNEIHNLERRTGKHFNLWTK